MWLTTTILANIIHIFPSTTPWPRVIAKEEAMNEKKVNSPSSISQASTIEEIAEYWNKHSLAEEWDNTKDVIFEVRTELDRIAAEGYQFYADESIDFADTTIAVPSDIDYTPLNAEKPPSMGSTMPETNADAGVSSHKTAPSKSSGSPKRPAGV
jgi:hypothetical protein